MLAYERASWTDEHLNPAPNTHQFELPHVESRTARWRWVEGSPWKIEGGTNPTPLTTTTTTPPSKPSPNKATKPDTAASTSHNTDRGGWIYYDNKWNDGKRDADSWGRYTRRRKWYRDAELVEVTSSTEVTPNLTPNEAAALSEAEGGEDRDTHSNSKRPTPSRDPSHQKAASASASVGLQPAAAAAAAGGVPGDVQNENENTVDPDSASSRAASHKRKSWFKKTSNRERRDSKSSSVGKKSLDSSVSVRTDPEDDHLDRWKSREDEGGRTFRLGEDAVMGLS